MFLFSFNSKVNSQMWHDASQSKPQTLVRTWIILWIQKLYFLLMLCGRSNMQLCSLMMVVSFGLQYEWFPFFVLTWKFHQQKKVLTGNGIGYLCLTAYIIWDEINLSEETPLPAIIIWALLSIWMLFVGLKKDSFKSE